jgi:thymidylate synthase (FAD)
MTGNEPICVLDHGLVRLVESMGSDLSISRAARVSYDAAWRAGQDKGSDERLIRYLWAHQHTSPFEAVTMTFEVKAPIFVLRQWMRHRTWSFSELSGRYRELSEEFYVPDPSAIGVQSKDNKQGRDLEDNEHAKSAVWAMEEHGKAAFALYRQLLSTGTPRELARTVLPLSTYSHMFATVNMLNLFRFLKLRTADDAQYEIRVYANVMALLATRVAPVAVAAWEASL